MTEKLQKTKLVKALKGNLTASFSYIAQIMSIRE